MYQAMRFHAAFRGGRTAVHTTLERFTQKCVELDIPFAVAGGMAVNANGDRDRVTHDIDVILTSDSLAIFKSHCLGRGWMEKFPGSRGMKDTVTNVPIDVLLAGGVPGSGNPSDTPVRFPDPAKEDDLLDFGAAPHLSLRRLIELKLASGLTDPSRLKDLVDVQVLIGCNNLPTEFSENLDPSVRPKFIELWGYAQPRSRDKEW
jgi:hypothetical protein